MDEPKPVLSDPEVYPTDEVIFSHIGPKQNLWKSLFEALGDNFPELTPEWRYYNDGKNWMMKVLHKKKTIFWLSVWKDSFKITFYFSDKAADLIEQSDISDDLKTSFKDGKYYGKIRGLTLDVEATSDIDHTHSLIAIRKKV